MKLNVSIHASVKDATVVHLHCPSSVIVSIHASVKDATFAKSFLSSCVKVSIHASVKDATFQYGMAKLGMGFNPRICKRCDDIAVGSIAQKVFQSTHL